MVPFFFAFGSRVPAEVLAWAVPSDFQEHLDTCHEG